MSLEQYDQGGSRQKQEQKQGIHKTLSILLLYPFIGIQVNVKTMDLVSSMD